MPPWCGTMELGSAASVDPGCPWCHSSTAESGRMCSGAARYSLVPLVIQTTLFVSWMITLHWTLPMAFCFSSAFPKHHPIPGLYCPLVGRLRLVKARRKTWSLSMATKARRARSRRLAPHELDTFSCWAKRCMV